MMEHTMHVSDTNVSTNINANANANVNTNVDNKTNTNVNTNVMPNAHSVNVDAAEVGKFTRLADEWWSRQGAFATLHDINPLRLSWIEDKVRHVLGSGLAGKRVLDVGCGGGILAESMARRGAVVTGLDLGEENLKAASVHAAKTGLTDTLDYQHVAVETLAQSQPEQFDVVTCMEMLEHVPDPASIVKACFDLLKPNGVCVLSTINRNPKAYLFAIIGAEYVLRLLDKGTHDYDKFITPAELDSMATHAGFIRHDLIGLHYNPLTKRYWLAQNVDVNYMMAVKKLP